MLNSDQINQIRHFNRQYTEILGVFNRKIFGTNLSWAEARIMIEIGINHRRTPMILAKKLQIDKSYVSRIINKLVRAGLLVKEPDPKDSRSVQVSFTDEGKTAFEMINQQSNQQISQLISQLNTEEQNEFFASIQKLDQLLFERK